MQIADHLTDVALYQGANVGAFSTALDTRIKSGLVPVGDVTVDGSGVFSICLGKPTHRSKVRRYTGAAAISSTGATLAADIATAVGTRDHQFYVAEYNVQLGRVVTVILFI